MNYAYFVTGLRWIMGTASGLRILSADLPTLPHRLHQLVLFGIRVWGKISLTNTSKFRQKLKIYLLVSYIFDPRFPYLRSCFLSGEQVEGYVIIIGARTPPSQQYFLCPSAPLKLLAAPTFSFRGFVSFHSRNVTSSITHLSVSQV